MLKSACIGFCRSRDNKRLQKIVKDAMEGEITEYELNNECKKIKIENWSTQKKHGVDIIPCNDFSFYDHMLDATCFVGNIQRRYYWEGGKTPLEIYFSIANGMQKDKFDAVPLGLKNWLNTNYLYHVPEFVNPIEFVYSDNKQIVEYLEAKSLGINTRPVIISPISYLLQGVSKIEDLQPIDLLDKILPVYEDLFLNCKRINIKELQFDDPMICLAVSRELKDKYLYCYTKLREYAGDIKINLVSYYSSIVDNFDFISSLPVDSIHIDIPYNIDKIDDIIKKLNKSSKISVGIIDSRSLWRNNLSKSIDIVSKFCDKIGDNNVIIANSSPLFLCPYSVELEKGIAEEQKKQLSFGIEKLNELEIIKKAINNGKSSIKDELIDNEKLFKNKTTYNLYKIDYKNKNKKEDKKDYLSEFEDFCKNCSIKKPALMLADCSGGQEEVLLFQDKHDFNVVSITKSTNGYDNSYFSDYVEGCILLKENIIPRRGNEYYNPFLIFDELKINDNIFVDIVKYAKKNTKKPIKLSLNGPVHFLNFSFVSPFLNPEQLEESICSGMNNCIDKVIKDIDLLQFNEFTIFTNYDYGKSATDDDYIINICKKMNNFINVWNKKKYVVLHSRYNDIGEIIRHLCELNISLLLLECYRDGFCLLKKFVSYKPKIAIGFGLFDNNLKRITNKNEIDKKTEKILSYVDAENVILTSDDCIFADKSNSDVLDKLFKRVFLSKKTLESSFKKKN